MPNDEATIAFLRELPAFADSSDEAVEDLADKLLERSVPAGELLIEQGTEADQLYMLADGKVEIFLREDSIGLEKVVHVPRRGELFGEIALLTGGLRTASVRTANSPRSSRIRPPGRFRLRAPSAAATRCSESP